MLTKSDITAHFEANGHKPSRALGQNFVVDPNIVHKIVRLAEITADTNVVEIGAGLGSLTLAIAQTQAKVLSIEIDRYLIDSLKANVAKCPNVEIICADAMTANWDELLPKESYTLVANLPYNVATPLVLDLLDKVPQITSMLVMVQKEVGVRMAATQGSKAFGAVSVKVAYWASAKVVGMVPPQVFVPQPRVDSCLVKIDRRPTPAVDPNEVDFDRLFTVIKAGFATRRKMLRNNLSGLVDEAHYQACGIAPTRRAEELDIYEWGALARIAK